MLSCSSIYNSQEMETTKWPSADEWIKKMWYIIQSQILFSHKKEWNPVMWQHRWNWRTLC
jgi:hypothetical protein